MSAAMHGEITADGRHIALIAAGTDVDIDAAASTLRHMTPAFAKSDPPGALIVPLTWPAVVQLGMTFDGNGHGSWHPGAKLTQWITDQAKRRTTAELQPPFPLADDLTPRPYQWDGARQVAQAGKFLVLDEAGPQPETTPLWTPEGWRTLGDLEPGDLVYDLHGHEIPVRAVKYFGKQPVYRVTFSDRTFTHATGTHLWQVYTRNDRHRGDRPHGRVMSTAQLSEAGLRLADRAAKFYLPQQPVIHGDDARDLPLDAYAYGALLGDGSLGGEHLSITCPDPYVVRRVLLAVHDLGTTSRLNEPADRCLNAVFHRDGKLRAVLERLQACKPANGKAVHPQYLVAGEKTRRAVLAGLLDTDGSVANAAVEFSSCSLQLAADVAWLARSLGAVVTESEPQPAFYKTGKGDRVHCQAKYRLHIRMPADGPNPFRLPRKADTWSAAAARMQRRQPPRTFESIEPAGTARVCCIELETDDSHARVYLTDTALIPTHNTGKTITTILSLQWRAMTGIDIFPCGIVVPSWEVADNWAREIAKWWVLESLMPRVAYWAGPDRQQLAGTADIYLTSYATARIDAPSADGPLVKLGARAVVLDEFHYLKNPDAKRSLAARRIAGKAQTVIALSGTPITRDTGDLWPALNALDPDAWPSRERMVKRYCERADTDYGERIEGLKQLAEPEFRACLLGSMRRVAKADVLDQLPPKVYSVRRVEIPPEWRHAYDTMLQRMLAELPDGGELPVMNTLAQLGRLIQLASSAADVTEEEVIDEATGEPKIKYNVTLKEPSWKADALVRILAERPGQQVVCFASSSQLMNIAGGVAHEAGYRVGYITGNDSRLQRKTYLEKFAAGNLDLICATDGAGGTGINELVVAGTAVFLQRSFALENALQPEDRLHRIGQTHACVEIIDLVAADTVDERVREKLRGKAGQFAEFVKDPRVVRDLLGGIQ